MENISETVKALKALGDSTRFQIVSLLSSTGNKLCVNAISENLNIAQPVVSQHLKILKNADIVISERMGNHIHYSIHKKNIGNIADQLRAIINLPSTVREDFSCVQKKKEKICP